MMRGALRLAVACAAGLLMAAQPVPETDGEQEGYRIVRGTLAAPDSARWQVQIFTTVPVSDADLVADRALPADDVNKRFYDEMPPWERDHVCGGVLIAEGWVLSAAHCFVNSREELRTPDMRRVRLGNVYLPYATEMAVERVIVHGDYRRSGDKRHDIALVKIRRDARTNDEVAAYAEPVRMLAARDRPLAEGDVLKVTGWGMTGERKAGPGRRDVDGKALRGAPSLLEAQLEIVPMARCEAVPSYRKTLWEGVLCVAGDYTGQDSCQGDSGGPLTRRRVLVGLVSSGFGCGLKGVPALYTRVSSYADWIDEVMKASKPGMATRCAFSTRWFRTRLVCDE